jgi:hypothetical protein
MFKKINKKAQIDNWLALLWVGLGMIVIFGGLFLIMSAKMKGSTQMVVSDLNIVEGMYTTRIILNEEVSENYKVYEAVIDYVNGKNPEFSGQIHKTIQKFYPTAEMQTDKWLIIVNENCYTIGQKGWESSIISHPANTGRLGELSIASDAISKCDKDIIDKMPKVTVPNPEGENILVLFKPESYLDGETGRMFGYRADMMKGISSDGFPEYSLDGKRLVEIDNIPKITCDAADTSVGKICAADEMLVEQLRLLSSEKLKKENMQIIVTQAYRTYDIQKRLYDDWCAKGNCGNGCNPDTNLMCPHMVAGAVDIIMLDSSGKALNGAKGYNPKLVEEIMCSYGFVRYNKEDWHFEYGTRQWALAEDKRAKGEKACVY